jgi:SecD/SecF fusion protein
VVVFDRVRELWGSQRKLGFAKVVNSAIVQTVPRTVNTGLGAVFILSALAFLGGDSLTDFAIALLIGIGVGTYSSMFTASPLAIELERVSPSPPPPLRPSSTSRSRGEREGSGAVV